MQNIIKYKLQQPINEIIWKKYQEPVSLYYMMEFVSIENSMRNVKHLKRRMRSGGEMSSKLIWKWFIRISNLLQVIIT